MKDYITLWLEYKKEKERQRTIREAMKQRKWILDKFYLTSMDSHKLPAIDNIISQMINHHEQR